MAAAKPAPRRPVIFDETKLQSMAEPLTVRIERVKGNTRQVMPVPRREGFNAQGQGWTQDEVREIEQWTVGSFGGGTYDFSVTDSSEPVQVLVWGQMWPLDQYPQKTPLPFTSDMPVGATPPTMDYGQSAQAPWQLQMPPSPPTINPSAFGAPPMGGNHNPWPAFNYGWAPPAATPAAAPREDYRREAEHARLQAVEQKGQLDRLMEENRRLAAEAAKAATVPREDPAMKAQLEREREERREERHRNELAALEARIAANAKPAEDPRLAQLIEENKRLAADQARRDDEHRRERDEERRRTEERAERDAAERRHQESLAALRTEQQAAQARLEALIAANTAPKTDPMMAMLMSVMDRQASATAEQARLQAEAAKDAARIQAEAVKDQSRGQAELVNSLKPFMMAPIEVARMIGDASQGQHQFMGTMTKTFTDAFGTMRDTYRGMMEAMAGPGESPALRVIEGAVGSAKEMFERWTAGKSTADVARMNAQRDVMTAQAHAMRPIMPNEQQPAPAAANGNGGAAHAAPAPAWQPPPPVANAGLAGAPQQAPMVVDGTLRKGGKTDAQWFGSALNDVLKMRQGIVFFIQSVGMNPPRMDPSGNRPLGIGPDQAAQLIINAAALISQMGIGDVLAFNYLFNEKMYDSLLDVILPEGFARPELAKGFREDTLGYLYRLLGGESINIPTPIPPEAYQEIIAQMGYRPAPVAPQVVAQPPQPATQPLAEFPPGSEHADERDVVEVVEVVAAPPQPVAAPARRPQPAGNQGRRG